MVFIVFSDNGMLVNYMEIFAINNRKFYECFHIAQHQTGMLTISTMQLQVQRKGLILEGLFYASAGILLSIAHAFYSAFLISAVANLEALSDGLLQKHLGKEKAEKRCDENIFKNQRVDWTVGSLVMVGVSFYECL